jgi:hypothetical protein
MEECEMDAFIFFDMLMAKSPSQRTAGGNPPGFKSFLSDT